MIDILEYITMEKRFDYPDDILKAIKVCADRNVKITPEQVEYIWSYYSDTYCAGWLGMPDDEELFKIIIEYAKKCYCKGEV